MANLTRFARLAMRLISKNGALVTHTMNPARESEYDSTEDERVAPANPTSQQVYAVITPYTPLFGLGAGQSFQQEGRKLVNSRSLLIASVNPDGTSITFEPEPGDLFEFEGRQWTASVVKKEGPDGNGITYEVGVSAP